MTDLTTFETGEFALADSAKRILRGLVAPFGETGQNDQGEFVFSAGTVSLPTEAIDLWIGHEHKVHLGASVALTETERGIEADFAIDEGLVGDRFLAEYAKGKKHNLSAEFAAVARDGINVVRSTLTGVAAVVLGGFASAALFELVEGESIAAESAASFDSTSDAVKAGLLAGLRAHLISLGHSEEEIDALSLSAIKKTPSEASADEAEVTPETEPESPAIEIKEDAMAEAVAPNVEPEKKALDANSVFELITAVKESGSTNAEFALADIKISGTGALPASGVLQPSWLGEVWAGVEPTRRYTPLIKSGTITALTETGFVLSTGSELVKSWAGNKAELPTGTATTSVVNGDALQKWGFAADIAREFYDIPAGKPVIDAFVREIFRSYARVTDKFALQKIYAAAGAKVVHDTYPAGYSTALGKLIQGVDTIDDTDVTPTFAVVAADVWTELRRTPKDLIPEYISFAFGRQEGTADGVTVIRDKAGVLAAGEVLVGSRDAAHMNELPNAPIQLDALDLAHGGLDKAVVGYSQYMTEYAPGFILLGNASA